jgi:DNA-directed RNA polymerase subunit RPC12/RpoP
MDNWTKYDYLCTDCDALIEITTLVDLRRDEYTSCPCGSNKVINIGVSDAFTPIITDVSKVTPTRVVKIDSNPYN